MNFPRQYRIYEEKFNHPLRTGHGLWENRESIILREEKDDGFVAYGEIAPTPGFSNCELERYIHEATDWERGEVSRSSPLFLSALSCLSCEIWEDERPLDEKPVFTAVLNFGGESEDCHSKTIKRKIGLRPVHQEIDDVLSWVSGLSDLHRVRLDANESLDLASLRLWIDALEGEPKLEFVEQPLPRGQLDEMIRVSTETSICFALDESVLSWGGPDALKEKGWQGYYVLKPSLMKDWKETINFVRSEPDKSLVSTVFESPFGYEAVCRIAGMSNLAAGADRSLFKGNAKEFPEHHEFPLIPHSVNAARLEELWDTL
jgi:o-succinylbenzoate synthase